MPLLEVRRLRKSFTLHLLGGREIQALERPEFDLDSGSLGNTGPSGNSNCSGRRCICRTHLPMADSIFYETAGGGLVDLAQAPREQLLAWRRSETEHDTHVLQVISRVSALEIVAQAMPYPGVPHDEARKGRRRCWLGYASRGVTFSGGGSRRLLARASGEAPPAMPPR